MGSLILKAALSYLEANPQVVGQLIGELVTFATNELKKKNAATVAAK